MGLKYPKESLYKIWIKLVQWFQRRGCLKMLKDRRMLRTDDRQSQSHWYTISSPMSLRLRWAKNVGLKIVANLFDINFYICFGCSKEPSHWDDSFEYLNHMFWLKIWKVILNCIFFFYHEAFICGHFSRGIMLLDLEMNHQISTYCLLCNRICEHGTNLKKKEPLISKQVWLDKD